MAKKSRVIVYDRGFKKAIEELKEFFQDKEVVVGIIGENAEYNVENDFNMAQLGAVHEFGSFDGRIPQRSFLRATFDQYKNNMVKAIIRAADVLKSGKKDATQLQKQLGLYGEGLVKRRIQRGINPPNAPSTIARKGSSTPLIDTGRLVQSITYEVREKTDE